MRFRGMLPLISSILILQLSLVAVAQDESEADEEQVHDEIRALRDGALEAYDNKDIEQLLTYLHPNVIITVQNAETLHGHQEVREFHERMSVGDKSKVVSTRSVFKVDDLSTLYGGDTAIAVGSMDDEFKLRSGMEFSLHSRWTASMVKEDGKWLVNAFHVSADVFDNGVSRLMLWWRSVWVGVIAAGVGALCGALIMARVRRSPNNPSSQS